jgi:DNA repair protein RadA/Sms
VTDPKRLLLGDRRPGQAGSAVLAAVDGQRPIVVEVQALVGGASGGGYGPRRQVQGLDGGRAALVLAVADRTLGLRLERRDVFASVVGGVRVGEPAADLALALALVSAWRRRPVPADVVAFGEVGLGGELRLVPHARARLEEAARLGFRRAVVPPRGACPPSAMSLVRARTLEEAVALVEEGATAPPAGTDRRGRGGRDAAVHQAAAGGSPGTIEACRSA